MKKERKDRKTLWKGVYAKIRLASAAVLVLSAVVLEPHTGFIREVKAAQEENSEEMEQRSLSVQDNAEEVLEGAAKEEGMEAAKEESTGDGETVKEESTGDGETVKEESAENGETVKEESAEHKETKKEESEGDRESKEGEANGEIKEVSGKSGKAEESAGNLAEEGGLETKGEDMEEAEQIEPRVMLTVAPRSDSMTAVGQSSVYAYTGGIQSFVAQTGGLYRIECFGGRGGDAGLEGYTGGKGGSVSGVLRLKKGQVLYIAAGGAGSDGGRHSNGSGELNSAAYNGGGRGGWDESSLGNRGRWRNYGSGGGATDIRIDGAGVENQIMVAGGGGGAAAGGHRSDGGNADGGSYNGRRLNGDDGGNGSGGGGGGGGYLGGKAGKGGSGYVDRARFSEISFRSDANSGNGYAVITVVSLAPEFSVVKNPEGITGSDVTLRVEIEDEGLGLEKDYICWKEEGKPEIWTENRERTVAGNGTYLCRVRDREGNVSEVSVAVDNIDKLAPELTLVPDTQEWTKEGVSLTAEGKDSAGNESSACSGLPAEPFLWGGKMTVGEPDGPSGWTEKAVFYAEENGTYLCRIRDLAGNESTAEYVVKNIDKTPPQVTFSREGKWYEGSLRIFFDAQDRQPDGSPGCGLHSQAYSFDGHEFSESSIQTIDREGTYGVWVRDRLGNVSQTRFSVFHDRKEEDVEDRKADSRAGKKTPERKEADQEIPEDGGEEKAGEEITDREELDKTEQKTENRKKEPRTEQEEIIRHTVHMEQADNKKLQRVQLMRNPADIESREETSATPRRILYSLWLAAVLGGLLWLLISLIFENVTVYRKDEKGKYRRAGRCAIIRKQEYRQINLTTCLRGDDADCKVRFTRLFVWMNAKKKVLIRTYHGIELRNITKEIEILTGV